MKRRRQLRTGTLAALALLAATACDSANLIGPDNQLEVTSATDNFQFQVSALQNVSQTVDYDWEITGTRAKVDISQAITSGSAMLTITDADGAVVYEDDIAADNDGDTPPGTAGTWRISVRLVGVVGTFNFRVQKVT